MSTRLKALTIVNAVSVSSIFRKENQLIEPSYSRLRFTIPSYFLFITALWIALTIVIFYILKTASTEEILFINFLSKHLFYIFLEENEKERILTHCPRSQM